MSKQLFLFLSIICFNTVLQAQNIHFGITGDVNLTQMHAKGLVGTQETGFNGGVYALTNLSKKWSLQPELLYTNKNVIQSGDFSTYYVNEANSYGDAKVMLSYLTIPVLFNYRMSKIITLNAGPEYSLLLYSNDDWLMTGRSSFKQGDAGVTGGIQVTVSPAFNIFGSYYLGLLNFNKIDDRYQWHDNQMRFGINVRLK